MTEQQRYKNFRSPPPKVDTPSAIEVKDDRAFKFKTPLTLEDTIELGLLIEAAGMAGYNCEMVSKTSTTQPTVTIAMKRQV